MIATATATGALLEPPALAAEGGVSIEVEHLAKHYGEVRAVDDISFTAREGEIFGLLGHNGAGKTTTIRMLTGRARPTSGSARVAGHDVVHERERMKPLINLVFEDQNLYLRLSGRENLQLFAELYGVPRARVDELLEAVGLVEAAKRKVKTYSSGMKQRLLVARALVNRPRVLFLDEPTRGLDPTSAREVRDMVREQARTGTTVFLTTHYMEEADELCDRVAFLASGRIVALDTPRELKLLLRRAHRRGAARHPRGEAATPRRRRRRGAPRCAGWPRAGSSPCIPRRARSRTSSSTWPGGHYDLVTHPCHLPEGHARRAARQPRPDGPAPAVDARAALLLHAPRGQRRDAEDQGGHRVRG